MTETLDDDLERLLDDVQTRLSGIELVVSDLETGKRPAPLPRLLDAPPPRAARTPAVAPPQPASPPEPAARTPQEPAPPPKPPRAAVPPPSAPPPEPAPPAERAAAPQPPPARRVPVPPAAAPSFEDDAAPPGDPAARLWELPPELRETPPERPLAMPSPRAPATPRTRGANAGGLGLVVAVALASVAAVSAGWLFWHAPRPRPDRVVQLDPSQALALRPDRGDVLVAQGPRLVEFSEDGRMRDWQALDAPLAGLAWSQGALWSVDATTSTVERRSNGKSVVFALNHLPIAICTRDRYLWTLERGGERIHQYMLSTTILGLRLLPLDVYRLPGLTADSIALDDGGVLWLVDKGSRRLYRLRLEGISYQPIDSASLTPLLGSTEVRGLGIEHGAVWLLVRPEGSAHSFLHRIPVKLLYWTPA